MAEETHVKLLVMVQEITALLVSELSEYEMLLVPILFPFFFH